MLWFFVYYCASARVAQLVEQRFRKAWVASSILASGSCVGIYFLFSYFFDRLFCIMDGREQLEQLVADARRLRGRL